jgi:hypothetical protein
MHQPLEHDVLPLYQEDGSAPGIVTATGQWRKTGRSDEVGQRRPSLAGPVEGDRFADERFERGLVNVFSFVDVDRTAYVSVETRIEETGGVPQSRPFRERQLRFEMSADADWPWLASGFFMLLSSLSDCP